MSRGRKHDLARLLRKDRLAVMALNSQLRSLRAQPGHTIREVAELERKRGRLTDRINQHQQELDGLNRGRT